MKLAANSLYILSGVQASGKSTFLQNGLSAGTILPEMVISSDQYRQMVVGSVVDIDNGTVRKYPREHVNPFIFEMMTIALNARMSERLTTFIDATNVTESDRNAWAVVAEKHNMPVELLVFKSERSLLSERNRNRTSPVPESVIDKFLVDFELAQDALEKGKSNKKLAWRQMPAEPVTPDLTLNVLPVSNVDVIGDVHGLGTDLLQFLETLGYSLQNEAFVHEKGRKLLFLGDFIDRGQESIKVLRWVMNSVQREGHFAVLGNHENKLLQFAASLKAGKPEARSPSSAETAMVWLRLPKETRDEMIRFLESLPGYYVQKDLAFFHAPVRNFIPLETPHSELVYGTHGKNIENLYQERYNKELETYTVFHGHIAQTAKLNNIFSLEQNQAFAGHLVALPLDKWLSERETKGNIKAFDDNIETWKCHFNFSDHRKKKFKLWTELRRLKDESLVYANVDPGTGMTLFKFTKDVFWNAKWGESPVLMKLRGLVMDQAGNIVQHPFDKIFNRKENGTGDDWAPDRRVIAVDKLNGFLGCIGWDPFRNDLLITTTGSFDSDFVCYIKELLDPKTTGKIKGFLSKNPATLMFEVIHPNDPHIIHYGPEMMGLHLIGGRNLGENDPHWTEDRLDEIAGQIGLRRPKWREMRYDEVLASVQSLKHEGYVIRNVETQVPEMKIKTPYYLITKFLGRLSTNKVKHMFGNPDNFKRTIDEEFYALVDNITGTYNMEDFLAMSDNTRIAVVRRMIEPLYQAKIENDADRSVEKNELAIS
jgi:predicted kinase